MDSYTFGICPLMYHDVSTGKPWRFNSVGKIAEGFSVPPERSSWGQWRAMTVDADDDGDGAGTGHGDGGCGDDVGGVMVV